MTEELALLQDISKRLMQAQLPYMITGSMALNFYARPRMTRDIDIVIELQKQGIKRLANALEPDYFFDSEGASLAFESSPVMFNVMHKDSLIKLDFMIRRSTNYSTIAFQRRRYHDVADVKIALISPEDLVLAKLNWARESESELQLEDIRSLLRSQETLDRSYLEHWVRELNLGNLWKKV